MLYGNEVNMENQTNPTKCELHFTFFMFCFTMCYPPFVIFLFYIVVCTVQEVNRENMKVKILAVEVCFLSPFHYVSLWVMPDKSPLIQNYIKDNYANHSALKQT